jgi:hypothetical protein
MSELSDQIENAQSYLANAQSALGFAGSSLDQALSAAEAGNSDRISEIISEIEDALTSLSGVEDNLPGEYSEVGNVARESARCEDYLSEAMDRLRNAVSSLEDLT